MGWSNVAFGIVTATQVILFDDLGNRVGSLDGSRGLVLIGNGTDDDPGFEVTPFGDMLWGSSILEIDASIEVSEAGQVEISSGAQAGQTQGAVIINSQTAAATGPAVQVFRYLYGNQPDISSSPPAIAVWFPLPLMNTWGNVGGAVQVAQYRAMPDGTVMCRGSITGGTATAFGTLPASYRPAASLQFPVGGGTGVAAGNNLHVVITAAGVMTINGESAVGGSFALDGIRFALPDLV